MVVKRKTKKQKEQTRKRSAARARKLSCQGGVEVLL